MKTKPPAERILMASKADMRGTRAAMCSILLWAGEIGNAMLTEEIHTHSGDCNSLFLKPCSSP